MADNILVLTIIMFGSMLILLLLGIHIAWAMGIVAISVSYMLWGASSFTTIIANLFSIGWMDTFICIPYFVFLGNLLERSGIAESLFDGIYRWTSGIKGGLAMGVIIICAVFAAMVGIVGPATITMALVALPAMEKRKYDKTLALGCVLGGGTLGVLIPPSIIMVMIGVIGEVSVGKLFFAGYIPGLIMTTLFMLYIFLKVHVKPGLAPKGEDKFGWKEKFECVKVLIAPILIILSVMGSIFFGIATVNESAAIGVLAIIIVTYLQGKLSWKIMKETMLNTLRISCSLLFIAFFALTFSKVFTAAGGVIGFERVMEEYGLSETYVLWFSLLALFILGTIIEGGVWIVVPVSFPIMIHAGVDPYWYGMLLVIIGMTAWITPPVGISLFYMRAILPPGITMADVYRSVWPYVGIQIITMILVYFFPQLALLLPDLMR